MDNPTQIQEALCPPGLSREERESFFDQTLDVMALPGAYVRDRWGAVEEMTQTLVTTLTTALAGKKMGDKGVNDGLWKHRQLHTLGKIKNVVQLLQVTDKVKKCWEPSWEAPLSCWHNFLYLQGYADLDAEAFCHYSLLLVII